MLHASCGVGHQTNNKQNGPWSTAGNPCIDKYINIYFSIPRNHPPLKVLPPAMHNAQPQVLMRTSFHTRSCIKQSSTAQSLIYLHFQNYLPVIWVMYNIFVPIVCNSGAALPERRSLWLDDRATTEPSWRSVKLRQSFLVISTLILFKMYLRVNMMMYSVYWKLCTHKAQVHYTRGS